MLSTGMRAASLLDAQHQLIIPVPWGWQRWDVALGHADVPWPMGHPWCVWLCFRGVESPCVYERERCAHAAVMSWTLAHHSRMMARVRHEGL